VSGLQPCSGQQQQPHLIVNVTDDTGTAIQGAAVTIRDTTANNDVVVNSRNNPTQVNATPQRSYLITVTFARHTVIDQAVQGVVVNSAASTLTVTVPDNNDVNVVAAMRATGIVRAVWNPAVVNPHHNAAWGNVTAYIAQNSFDTLTRSGTQDSLTTMEIDTLNVPNGTAATITIVHGTAQAAGQRPADIGFITALNETTHQYDEQLAPDATVIRNLEVQNNQVVVAGSNRRPTHRFHQRKTRPLDLWGAPRQGVQAGNDSHDPYYYFIVTLTSGGPFGTARKTSTNALQLRYWHISVGDAIADMDAHGDLGSLKAAHYFANSTTDANNVCQVGWFNQSGPKEDVRKIWGSMVRNSYMYCHLLHGTVHPYGVFKRNKSAFCIGGTDEIGTQTDEYRCTRNDHRDYRSSKEASRCDIQCATNLQLQAWRAQQPSWYATCAEHNTQEIAVAPGYCDQLCGAQLQQVSSWSCDNHGTQFNVKDDHRCDQDCDDPTGIDGKCPRHQRNDAHKCQFDLVEQIRYQCARHNNIQPEQGQCDTRCGTQWTETHAREWTCQYHNDQRFNLNAGVCQLDCGRQRAGGVRQIWSCPTHPEVVRRYAGMSCPVTGCQQQMQGPVQMNAADAEDYSRIWGADVEDADKTPSVPKYLVVMFSCSAGQEESIITAFHTRGTWYVGAFKVSIKCNDAESVMNALFTSWGGYMFNPYKIEECWNRVFNMNRNLLLKMQPVLRKNPNLQ